MGLIRKIYHQTVNYLRISYKKIKRKRLKNTTMTILCNNCTGSIIYHDMKLRFLSPTINLFFNDKDFLTYIEHIKDFEDAELVEIRDEACSYPVGRLISNKTDLSVRIDFMHYKSFDQAKDKWFERSKRINYDNIYIIFEGGWHSDDCLARFDVLNYEHKILITSKETAGKTSVNAAVLKVYDNNYHPGMALEYPTTHSYKRNLDSFNYIKFLNN